MNEKRKAEIQEFKPPADVIKRAFIHEGTRPTIEDIEKMARATIEDLDEFIHDKKAKRRMKKAAMDTIRLLKVFKG